MIGDLDLATVRFEDHLLIMKVKFDLTIAGEPYHARTLIFNLKTGKFLSRIWSKTVSYGCTLTLEDLREECERHFKGGNLCLGLLQGKSEQERLPFHAFQTPVPRKVSKYCKGILGKVGSISVYDDVSESFACEECIKLKLPVEAPLGTPKTYKSVTPPGDTGSVCEVDMEHDLWLNQVVSGYVKARDLGGSSVTTAKTINLTPALSMPAPVTKNSREKKTWVFNMGDKSRPLAPKSFTQVLVPESSPSQVAPNPEVKQESSHDMHEFRCPVCFYKAVGVASLRHHMEEGSNHGEGNPRVKCPTCRKQFEVDNLESHKCTPFEPTTTEPDRGQTIVTSDTSLNVTNFKYPTKNPLSSVATGTSIDLDTNASTRDSTTLDCPLDSETLEEEGRNTFPRRTYIPKAKTQRKESVVLKTAGVWGKFFNAEAPPASYGSRSDARDQMDGVKSVGTKKYRRAQKRSMCTGTYVPGRGFFLEDDSQDHYSKELKRYKCPYCDEVFRSRYGFHDHRKLVHHWGKFFCAESPNCTASFSLLKDLIRHMYDHNHDSNPLVRCGGGCRKIMDVSEMADHYVECISRRIKQRKFVKNKPKQCMECGKMCTRATLPHHLETHIKEKNVHCDKCPKRFKTNRLLQIHIRNIHEGIFVPQTCATCGAVFRTKNALAKHEYDAHNIGELKLCTLCGFSCVTERQLKLHAKIYHEDPKLQCSYCPKIVRTPQGRNSLQFLWLEFQHRVSI